MADSGARSFLEDLEAPAPEDDRENSYDLHRDMEREANMEHTAQKALIRARIERDELLQSIEERAPGMLLRVAPLGARAPLHEERTPVVNISLAGLRQLARFLDETAEPVRG